MIKKPAILLSLLCTFSAISAQENDSLSNDILSMDIEELINTKVSIATRSEQPINESPSTISVITSEDIKNLGIRQLEDVLQMIPGFDITMVYNSYYTVGVRGVRDSRNTSKILVMIDGSPINQIFYGCAIYFGYDINIDNIEKIEIIRGPGSALYGRNAFSAVINIISKKNHDGHNVIAKGTAGAFNTQMLSGFYGYKRKKLDVSVSIRHVNTDVSNEVYNDTKYVLARNTNALNTKIKFGKFGLSGIIYDLDYKVNNSFVHHSPAFYSLTYEDQISQDFNFFIKLYGHNAKYYEDIELLAPDLMPDYPLGIYVKPQFKEYTYGIESTFNLRLNSKNDLLFGIEADLLGTYNAIITSNADSLSTTPVAIPGRGRNDQVLYEPGWLKNDGHKYQNFSFFAQDIWRPYKVLNITLGTRFDYDSQFGSQFNPRLGVVYQPLKNGNIKVLYGRAYRAPTPREQYAIFGFVFGNENLKPEVINTFEFATWYRYRNFSNSVNLFWNSLRDMIYSPIGTQINPDFRYHNIGQNISRGIEYENKVVIGKWFQSFLNASYTVSKNIVLVNNSDSVYNHPDVAPFKLNFGTNFMFMKYVSWNISMLYRSKMEKFYAPDPSTGDLIEVQDPIGNYAIFNSTLRIKDLIPGTDFSISIYNMFDKDYYGQDNENLHLPSQPGRQILFNLTYTL
jgi:outer membrane receptor for ferrienterochelin and colicin